MIVLVVEDEALLAMALHHILVRAGHDVVGPTGTASSALALAERTRPDMALVDINLRGAGKGTDLARAMYSRWNTPVIFATASVSEARANGDVALGYLAKPYSPEDVVASIEVAKRIIEGGRPPPPHIPHGLEMFPAGAA